MAPRTQRAFYEQFNSRKTKLIKKQKQQKFPFNIIVEHIRSQARVKNKIEIENKMTNK